MRKANFSDKSIILHILTRSFDDNKSVNYVIKQGQNRVDRIKRLMDYAFNMCNAFGEVWIAHDQQACALVLFPDKKQSSFRTLLWDFKLALSVIGFTRVTEVLKREAMIKLNHPREPFAYLWFIGVNPEVQGKGVGSSLVQGLIREYENKRPIYLETSMQRNLPFYEKLGFEIFSSMQLTYTLYQLRRM